MSHGVRPQDVVERALALSTADDCVVIAEESSEANLRFAGNTLTTNGVMRGRSLTVIATVAGREGTAVGTVERSNVGLDQVESLVRAAEAAARDGRPAEDAAPLVAGEGAEPGWADDVEETSIGVFAEVAPALGEAFAAARAEGRELFGFAEHQLETTFLATSRGVRRRYAQPTGRIEITGKTADWSRSSWVGQGTRDFADVDVARLDADVRRRLSWAARRVELPAGRYETLLPPSAVADFLIYQYWSSVARDAHDGRTVFSRPGGGTRVGEQL
ncbi:MAG TPA: TldD/PmbA family protein, partial [Actinomycetes bacterium]